LATDWNDFSFVVQMPHMAPGEKLSEVEFLKMIAAYQWEGIARVLGRRPSEIVSPHKERLYGSVIDVELRFAEQHSQELLGEDVEIHVRNRVRFYAKKFVEGLFVIDDKPIPDSVVEKVQRREDLRGLPYSWACMTNAFIVRAGGNVKLKVFKPEGADDANIPELPQPPYGITEQGRVQASGRIDPLGDDGAAAPLAWLGREPVVYTIVPESDLNGAGLVYFARYEAMMNYGERRFLCDRLEWPFSSELVSYLSTEHRKAFFFANASPTDNVEVRVSAGVLRPGAFPAPPASLPYRVPLKFVFRIDLHRGSDKALMASSLVRKSLNVPGSAKAVLHEAERYLRRAAS
jgi:probable biosynthetic protein (TIGR04098 family)